MKRQNQIWMIVLIALVVLLVGHFKIFDFQSVIGQPSLTYTYDNYEKTDYLYIGSDAVIPSSLKFVCEKDDNYRYPYPERSCWVSVISFQGKTIDVPATETVDLNEYLQISYLPVHAFIRGDTMGIDPDWKSDFVISFKSDADFLEAKIILDETALILNQEKQIKVQIRSDLADDIPGGIILYSVNDILPVPEINRIPFTFPKGISVHTIDLNASILGSLQIKVVPFITILDVSIEDDRTQERGYNIFPNIEFIETSVDCTDKECPEGFYCKQTFFEEKEYNICTKQSTKSITESIHEQGIIPYGWIAFFVIFIFLVGYIIKTKGGK